MNAMRYQHLLVFAILVGLMAVTAVMLEPAKAFTPPNRQNITTTQATPTVRPLPSGNRGNQGSSSFNWQGFIGNLSHDMESRPMPSTRPIRPVRPIPDVHPLPVVPLQPGTTTIHVQPNTFHITEPITVESTTVQPPTVTNLVPKANVVKIHVPVPKQLSPLEGRVSEMSTREAQVYAKELADIIGKRLTAAIGVLEQGGVETTVMQKQAESVRQMMTSGSRLKDMEATLKSLLQGDTSKYPSKVLDDLRQIAQLIALRDAFLVVAAAPPRARSGALPLAAIPIGEIWILFDPSLAAGTALLVNDFILVVGTGGQGEVAIVKKCAAAALGLPVAPGNPVPDIAEAEATSLSAGIVIQHPGNAGGEVHYILNGRHSYTIQPGEKQSLADSRAWTIEFDRGNSQGTARYSLERGVYEFRVVNEHWDLVHVQFDITIDNREGKQDFAYVAGEKVTTVKAGEQQSYNGTEPLVVKFDRGDGPDQAVSKNLNKNGTYKVAVNSDTNLLDLYAVSEPQQAATP
jgi:hypothetical protein